MGVPLRWPVGEGCPENGWDAEDDGDEVDTPPTIRRSKRLPKQIAPAKKEKHEAGSKVKLTDSESLGLSNLGQDRVVNGSADTNTQDVEICHGDGNQLASSRPVQGIFRVSAGLRLKNDLAAMAEVVAVVGFIPEQDGTGDIVRM